MKLFKHAGSGLYPRPAIIEMGGKNPAIVSNTADINQAAQGVMRSAFGLDGQKCSACSRVYVQAGVYEAFKAKLVELTKAIKVGDPTRRDVFMGTVVNKSAYEDYQRFMALGRADGTVLVGGNVLTEGDYGKGYFVEPAVIEGLPEEHQLVREELFLPILHLAKVETLDEAMEKANATPYGLTAGFFGQNPAEVEWFFDNIQAGTTLLQPRRRGQHRGVAGHSGFWRLEGQRLQRQGIGGLYTLALYMREQSRTIIG